MYGTTIARLFDGWCIHGVDFRIKFESGYELSARFTERDGSFLWGGFPRKEKEIAKKGIVYGQVEYNYDYTPKK
jgi:hypothetical protein